MRVLLQQNPAQDLPVERTEAVETALHIENEDDRVLEGADGTARGPSTAHRVPEQRRRTPDLHRGVEISPEQVRRVAAVEAEAFGWLSARIRGLRIRLRARLASRSESPARCCGCIPLRLGSAFAPRRAQLQRRAHSQPPASSAATPQTLTSGLRFGRPRRFRLSGAGNSFSLTSQPRQYTLP